MDAVLYYRWSSTEQGRGSSLERQRNECCALAHRHGWRVVGEIIDEGVSAFKGRHANAGALGGFVRDVEAGLHPDGVVLVVEKLDRLSREEPGRVFAWMLGLTEAGVTVATVDGDRRYGRGTFDMASIIEIVVKAQLSHEESAKKASRLAAAWAAKRGRLERGEGGVMTARAPAWLAVEGNPPRFVVLEERAAVVRRIYEETVAGFGKHHIARRLNLECVPTFGRSASWHASYIQKLLNAAAVLGEFQPGAKPRGEKRVLVGDVVRDYFPPIVDADLHARARMAMRDRRRGVTGRGRRLVNLFSGLATCGGCEGKMTLRSKGLRKRADGRLVQEDYLICDAHQRGAGCGNGVHFNYGVWQEAVLAAVLVNVADAGAVRTSVDRQRLEVELATLERADAAARAKAAAALNLYVETQRADTKELWLRLIAGEAARAAALVDLRGDLEKARGVTPTEEIMGRIATLRSSLEDPDEEVRFAARAAVASALHEMVWPLRFHPPATCEIGVLDRKEILLVATPHGIDYLSSEAPD